MATYPLGLPDEGYEDCPYQALFATLTAKQHEVYALVAEGRSSKEIAWRLGITGSAVNQRIEAVRSRAGSPPRAELARAYRRYCVSVAAPALLAEPAYLTPVQSGVQEVALANAPAASSMLKDFHRKGRAPEVRRALARLVGCESSVRADVVLNRVAAMVVIATGLLTVAMLGLSVVQTLAAML